MLRNFLEVLAIIMKNQSPILYAVHGIWHENSNTGFNSLLVYENTVVRRVKDPVTKVSTTTDVPCPVMLEQYNKPMGEVD